MVLSFSHALKGDDVRPSPRAAVYVSVVCVGVSLCVCGGGGGLGMGVDEGC